MDFRHLIVTCLFSMLRLSFEAQKIKENYAIFFPSKATFLFEISYICIHVNFQNSNGRTK